MAPRKTKTAADTPKDQADLEKAAAAIGQLVGMGTALPMLDIDPMSQAQLDQEQRVQVALAVWPVFVRDRYDYAPAGDENYAGMAAREAFEYADAFIAQSKKGQGDGE